MSTNPAPTVPTDDPSRRVLIRGIVSMFVSVFTAPALVALVWRFPVMMAGVIGGDLGAGIGSSFTVFFWLTFGSLGLGALVVVLLGAGIGRLCANLPWFWTPTTTFTLALAVALAIAAVPSW